VTKQQLQKRVIQRCRDLNYSKRTWTKYAPIAGQFYDFSLKHPDLSREDKVTTFLSRKANQSASLQRGALCALVFMFKEVLGEPLGDLKKWQYAKTRKRIPEWLNQHEAARLLDAMAGPTRIMAELAYGSGLRLKEVVHLRVKDLDFERKMLVVRHGKGGKDRTTAIYLHCVPDLAGKVVSPADRLPKPGNVVPLFNKKVPEAQARQYLEVAY